MRSNQIPLFIVVPRSCSLVVRFILLECGGFKTLWQISSDRKQNFATTFSYPKASCSIAELSWKISFSIYWDRKKGRHFFQTYNFYFPASSTKRGYLLYSLFMNSAATSLAQVDIKLVYTSLHNIPEKNSQSDLNTLKFQ